MTTSELEERVHEGNEDSFYFDKYGYHEKVQQTIEPVLLRFKRTIRSYVGFHLAFFLLGFCELVGFLLFYVTLAQSSLVAVAFATMFLTTFSFFILRLYLQGRQPELFLELRDAFVRHCREQLHYQEGIPEHHLVLANAATKFASVLQDAEYQIYRVPDWLDMLQPVAEKFSCWWHWRDVHTFRELLLQLSIEEHLWLVKCEPTNLEVHAALANAYVLLSSLYALPAQSEDEGRWIHPDRYSDELRDRFRSISERAIEEFKILNHYAPDDLWVHEQLAYSYHDLQMPEEEIKQYEAILRLRPNDKETLFKLGRLYFKQGHNAEGLQVYEELKRSNYKQAENLIAFYGGCQSPA